MTASRARTALAGLVLVLATAAGCGDDDPEPAAGNTVDSTDSTTSTADSTEPAALPRFCDLVTPEEVTAAVGAAVTLEAGPLDSCEFGQEDPRALSGSLGAVEVDTGNGGFAAYRSGSRSTLDDGVDHPISGVGDEAFVATGTFAGGENLQGAGAVLVGGTAYTLALAQGSGLSEEELVAIGEKLLRLMADAA